MDYEWDRTGISLIHAESNGRLMKYHGRWMEYEWIYLMVISEKNIKQIHQNTMECSKDISLFTGSVDTSCKHNEATRPRDVATNSPFHLELGRSMGDPQNEWFLMENPIKMDHLGVPPFFGNHHLLLVLCIRMLHSYAFLAICDAEPVSNLPCSKCLLTLAH